MIRIILAIVTSIALISCGESEPRDLYMSVPYRTMESINHKLMVLHDIKLTEASNRVMIEKDLRSEINEFKICEEVLKKLKDMKESMTKEAWNIM